VTGDPVRDEAERLVAAAIAGLSLAARGLGGVAGSRRGGHSGSGFATGSPECCVCPVCRVISAMRDPNPDIAERLATGAGDLAAAVTGILRSLSRAGTSRTQPPDREGDEFWDSLGRRARDEFVRPPTQPAGSGWPGEAASAWPGEAASAWPGEARRGGADEDPWRVATRTTPPDDVLGSELSDHDLLDDAVLNGDVPPWPPVKKMAKKAVKRAPAPPPPPPTTPMAKKAVKKAASASAPPMATAPPAEWGPAPVKKAAKKAAKKATKKATPGGAEG
jgi:hypothetical protein